MGGSSYSDSAAKRLYSDVRAHSTRDDVFKVRSAAAATAAGIDPSTFKLRESRDSDAHPQSNAIAIFFDETGSMGEIPATFALKKLPGLMALITAGGYIEHPQILFGAVGDAYSDRMPLQVGQFESGLEMDEWLTKIFLEGNGGGTQRESYEMAMLWAARHTSMDCFEKRQKKGYLFLMGDEAPYESASKALIKKVIGDDVEADIATKDIVAEAQRKFEVFFIHCGGSYPNGSLDGDRIIGEWKALLGERCLILDSVDHVCELIATTIGLCEGRGLDTISDDLAKHGLDPRAVKSVTSALVPHASARDLAKPGTASADLVPTGAGGSTRI